MRHAKREDLVLVLLLLAVVAACSPQPDDNEIDTQAALDTRAGSDRGTVAAGPLRLRYRIEGTGRPAIVIGSATYLPRSFSQNLRKHLRLVFLDHRGYVPSPGPMDATVFALDKMLDDFERARQELRLGQVAVIGHSIHSIMALEYAKKYPENVSHVVMIGSTALNAGNAQAMSQYWQELASPERKAAMAENLRRLPDEQLAQLRPGQRWIRKYIRNGPRTWYDPEFDGLLLMMEGVERNDDYIPAFLDLDITQGLDTFDRPVFLALGRYDFIAAPPSIWDPIRPKFRDSIFRVFERSGHWPHYEEAALFDAELLRWMEASQ